MDNAVAYASGLRELADWMDEHPELASSIQASGWFYIFAYSKDEFRESARALGGHRAKNADDNWFNVEREFGPVKLQVTVPRSEVCEKKVTTREVIRQVPDPEQVALVPMVEVRTTVEEVEWSCEPSILAEVA